MSDMLSALQNRRESCCQIAWALSVVLCLADASLGAEPPPVELQRGLIAHWPLDGDGRDLAPRQRKLELRGVTFVADPLRGAQRKVAQFDGREAYGELPAAISPRFGRGDFSLSLWVQSPRIADDLPGDLVSQYDPRQQRGLQLTLKTNAGVTFNQANQRHLQFSIDNKRQSQWIDCGRPGKALLAFAMAVHEGELFAGTCEPGKDESGRVYRYGGGETWVDCGAPDASNAVTSFATWGGQLYAGVGKYRVAGSALAESENTNLGGKVYRYDGEKRWTNCGQLPQAESVGGLVVFRGKLYASSLYKPAGFFRYEGDKTWTDCGVPDGKRVEALGVYNGHLYATSYDGGRVYRFDGQAWTDCGQLGENTQTYAFAVYEGRLYVGTWNSGRVYRFEDVGRWTDVGRLGEELEVMGMLVHNGRLVAGTLPLADVYEYRAGEPWKKLTQLDATPDVKYRRAWTMAEHEGKVFCSTLPSGKVFSYEAGKTAQWGREFPEGWRHVAAMRSSGRLTLYVEGAQVAQTAPFSNDDYDLDVDRPLFIGRGMNDAFSGRMSDVRIYDRALSAAEVALLAKPERVAHNVRQVVAHRGSSIDCPENTLASTRRAIEAGATAVEVDVRRTRDGHLVLSHDATVDKTTDGKGLISEKTLAELKQLDAGVKFAERFRGERIPTLAEALQVCRGKVDVLLDLKESGAEYARQVAETVQQSGEPQRTIVGVRSVEQAGEFRRLLPKSRQIGLMAQAGEIESYAAAKVEMIRLWPDWLRDETLVPRVRRASVKLHLNASDGSRDDVLRLLPHQPDSLSSDDPARLVQTLRELAE